MAATTLTELANEIIADLFICGRTFFSAYPTNTEISLGYIKHKLETKLIELQDRTGLWGILNDLRLDLEGFILTGNVNYDQLAFADVLKKFEKKAMERPYFSSLNITKLHEIIKELKN